MGKILDFIVGNPFIFLGVLIVLLVTLVALITSIVKVIKKHKIPIYEEIDENVELENVKEENIIEKPTKEKKSTKAEKTTTKKEKEVKNKKTKKPEKEVVVILADDIEEDDEEEKKSTKRGKTKSEKKDTKEVEIEEKENIDSSDETINIEKEENIVEEKESEFEDIIEVFEDIDIEESKDIAIVEFEDITEEIIPNEPSSNKIFEEIEDEIQEDNIDEEIDEFIEDFDDEALREELEKIDDKEIENRIDEEHKKDIEDVIKENENEELKEILYGMKDTNELDPDEVVRNFEEEQEAQSIISYQELVNVVKQRETDFEDELESRPLTTVSDFLKNDKVSDVEPEIDVLKMIETIDKPKNKKRSKVENKEEIKTESILEEKETTSEITEERKFKKTDVISPVFGRMPEKENIDYPKVEKFDRRPKKDIEPIKDKTGDIEKEMQSVNAMFEDISTKVEEKNKEQKKLTKEEIDDDEEIETLSAISKNEDFLKALKDFRDSL